ncbi:MAG: hypothetical protein ACREN6_08845 [Gemmatimonadaceae bacterium]
MNVGAAPDSTEVALIADLKKRVGGASGDYLEHALAQPTVSAIQASDPSVQAILDTIFSRRRARLTLSAAIVPPVHGRFDFSDVTIALVDSLADPTSSAEVRRRTNQEPHDVILLPANHATVGAVEAALHGLGRMMRKEGQTKSARNTRIAVHGEKHMSVWSDYHVGAMETQLAVAAAGPRTHIAGIGQVRSFTIRMAHHVP